MKDYSAQDLGLGPLAVGPAGFDMLAHAVGGKDKGDGTVEVDHALDESGHKRALDRVAAAPGEDMDSLGKKSFSGASSTMQGVGTAQRRAAGRLAPWHDKIARINRRVGFRNPLGALKGMDRIESENAARRAQLDAQPKHQTERVDYGRLPPEEQEKKLMEAIRDGKPIPPGLTIPSPMQVARKLGHDIGHGLRHAYDKWGAALFPGSSPENIMHLRRK